jgi:Holliday junction resolvasome RuvABC endonuclease subunit
MTIISIDFSILYPGICICKDFKEFKWLSVVNTKLRKVDQTNLNYLLGKYPNIKIDKTTTIRKTHPEYHVTERVKLINYQELISKIVDNILTEVGKGEDIIVAIEGISFGSKGNSLVDIAQSTGILKHELLTRVLKNNADHLFIFSPSELKNAIGCKGNASKMDVFNQFKEDPQIEALRESDLYKAVHAESWTVNGDKIVSPIIDMVDAVLGIIKIYNLSK